MKLKQSKSAVIENIAEEDLFMLTLIGNIRAQTGRVKLLAKNEAGEATVEADLSVAGSPPTFAENPYVSEVLDGKL